MKRRQILESRFIDFRQFRNFSYSILNVIFYICHRRLRMRYCQKTRIFIFRRSVKPPQFCIYVYVYTLYIHRRASGKKIKTEKKTNIKS